MIADVTVWVIEMHDASALGGRRALPAQIEMRCADRAAVEFNRFLYTAVGGDWYWTSRLDWTYAEWQQHVGRTGHETWVAYEGGTPAGYFALFHDRDANEVEIENFGLMPSFIGRGLGAALLTVAVERAWVLGPQRVWLTTCSLDAPNALPNYLARGFTIAETIHKTKEIPDRPIGPWPGARS